MTDQTNSQPQVVAAAAAPPPDAGLAAPAAEPPVAEPIIIVPARPSGDRMRPVRIWLWIVAVLVFAMVIVGGATRLTDSGLSITEWKLLTGIIPPLDAAAWAAEFEKYKQIPQYSKLFPGMSVEQFKTIYLWEWGHRFLGRFIGIVFLLPLLWFLISGRVRGGLFWKLCGVLLLGALQGAVGWWMVTSGLSARVDVAPERLAVHLLLAAITFSAIVWIAAGLRPKPPEGSTPAVRREGALLTLLILLQIGLGGLVAGAKAGLAYTTWPLMDGHLVPAAEKLMKLDPWWLNFLENPTMLQFQHRMLAYLLVLLTLGHVAAALRDMDGSAAVKRAWSLVLLVLVQAGLGVGTVLFAAPAGKIPLHFALAHQAVAFMLLAMAVIHWRRISEKPA